MLRSEVLNFSSKSRHSVSFFEDDTIEVVRQQIGKATDIHPDRLLILVGLNLPSDYYAKDPRRWEALFERLSYNGDPIKKEAFQEYQLVYRSPNTSVAFSSIDKTEWMGRQLFEGGPDFVEYRILGVPEQNSFILPLTSHFSHVSKIAATRLPIPDLTTLISSIYKPSQIARFMVLPYDDKLETLSLAYFPLLKSGTPPRLSVESITLLDKNAKLLEDLLKLKAEEPEYTTILRTRFYVPWVDTDFGSAISTRFEQIFYGLTVSKDVPYIGIFTSKDQVSRHKFFVEDPNNKVPYLDTGLWTTWWNLTKPSRSRPTILLYRGTSKHSFDRIAITSVDMVVSTHRPEKSTETLEELKKSASEWIQTFDAIMPFIEKTDLDFERWDLQDLSFLAKYKTKIDEFDLLRFNCISSIFDIADKTKSQFSLLRTDHENDGVSAVEVKVLSMMKEGAVNPQNISEELSIPIQNARELIMAVEARIDDDPRIGQKSFRGYPLLKVGPDFVIISSVNKLEKPLEYSNLLRHILSHSESPEIDNICPKRMEKVVADTSIVPTTTLEVDSALAEEYSDLFGYLEQGDEEEMPLNEEKPEPEESIKKIQTEQKQGTIYNYFKNRLQQFDPETFDPIGSQYPKKCEQKHQPIVLSSSDFKRVQGTPYDPLTYAKSDQLVDIENPDGTIICPEYWCMRDQIPLQESQLETESGSLKCPVCRGKLQTRSSDDPREYPLVKRETGFLFPGFVDYKSPKNGRPMPCCFKKSRAKKNIQAEKDLEDKYYILGETKVGLGFQRISFIPAALLKSLHISETYEGLEGSTRRLQGGMSGFFRTGLGRPSETLAGFLELKTKIPAPRESVDTVLKCSFLRGWKTPGTKHLDTIKKALKDGSDELVKLVSGIDEAFENKKLSMMEDLEYSALALQCDVFRVFTNSNSIGCMFYAPMVRPRSRAIIILQNEHEIDILSHVTRKARGFEFVSNIFKNPFKIETAGEVEKQRNSACRTEIPSYDDALKVMKELEMDNYSVVLDPFGRGQAFYLPTKVVLPFQSSPLPDVAQSKLQGFESIKELPSYTDTIEILKIAQKISKGYTFKEKLYNDLGKNVEILVESGLRIPIKPESVRTDKEPTEVLETLNNSELGETKLAFGEPSQELKEIQSEISYSSEVFEFLLFQLSHDISIDYLELRVALQQVSPKRNQVEPLLKSWFSEITQFVEIKTPEKFISKMRTPCGENSCSGSLCGFNKKTGKCGIKIKDSIQKEPLFRRLLLNLLENAKIRSIVLDGRATPFFSTILYLELPHEMFLTDMDLK
jgi:hypothetical protein